MVKPKVEKETKHEKFKRIASYRTQKILEYLRRLGNCSNTSVYEYTEEDVKKIFDAISKELRRVRLLFDKPKKVKFSLR